MDMSEELAEVLGMFAADGCMQDNYICMWGNITEDKDYYDQVVCPLFSKVFSKNIVAHEKVSNGVYGFYLCDKKVVEFMKTLGFTKNKTYTVSVPKIIFESNDKKIFSAFIRGFADCDGCISFMKRKGKYVEFKRNFNTYPRVIIKVVSKQIIEDISNMLDNLGLDYTKYSAKSTKVNERDTHNISVRGPDRVNNWIQKIGFNNPSQFSKYLIWQKFGMCPAKIKHEQRKLILQEKIDPFSLTNP